MTHQLVRKHLFDAMNAATEAQSHLRSALQDSSDRRLLMASSHIEAMAGIIEEIDYAERAAELHRDAQTDALSHIDARAVRGLVGAASIASDTEYQLVERQILNQLNFERQSWTSTLDEAPLADSSERLSGLIAGLAAATAAMYANSNGGWVTDGGQQRTPSAVSSSLVTRFRQLSVGREFPEYVDFVVADGYRRDRSRVVMVGTREHLGYLRADLPLSDAEVHCYAHSPSLAVTTYAHQHRITAHCMIASADLTEVDHDAVVKCGFTPISVGSFDAEGGDR